MTNSVKVFRHPGIGETEAGVAKKFFNSLRVNEVFTYSDYYIWATVKRLALANNVEVSYCSPGSENYKKYGCYTCVVMFVDPKWCEHKWGKPTGFIRDELTIFCEKCGMLYERPKDVKPELTEEISNHYCDKLKGMFARPYVFTKNDPALNNNENMLAAAVINIWNHKTFPKDLIAIRSFTKDEKSLLLFLEDCAVNKSGKLDVQHMNEDDLIKAKEWSTLRFINFGRIKARSIKGTYGHWVELSDEAWRCAEKFRKERGIRNFKASSYERNRAFRNA